MSTFIETMNLWGERFLHFAWPMLWQSSLLIAIVFALDLALRRKLRAAIRYLLWMVVLVKLVLPPTLALPTNPAWWIKPSPPAAKTPARQVIVSYPDTLTVPIPAVSPLPVKIPISLPTPAPKLSLGGWSVVALIAIATGLLAWLLSRWRQVIRDVKSASPASEPGRAQNSLATLLDEAKQSLGMRCAVTVRLADKPMSPAVCGLFRATILLPHSLVENFSTEQLRAVLLHELIHLRRGDIWVNCIQALLQIFYWWHPLLWVANARIRRVREEAVDDAVMLALRDEADAYAPTLLEVAKLAFNRPLASLGLVGILESRNALRQRIERLVHFQAPRKAGITLLSLLCVAAFAVVAAPMGEGPAEPAENAPTDPTRPIAAQPTSEQTTNKLLSIEIGADGGYSLGTNRMDLVQLKAAFADAKRANPNPTLIVRANKEASMKSVTSLADAAQASGISAVNLAAPNSPIEQATKPAAAAAPNAATNKSSFAVTRDPSGHYDYLQVRTFKVDPNTFYQGLQTVAGRDAFDASVLINRADKTKTTEELVKFNSALDSCFTALGLDLSPKLGKAVTWDDRRGELLVRATSQDLGMIEMAVQALNAPPPQINIRAKFVEIEAASYESLISKQPQYFPANTNSAQFVQGLDALKKAQEWANSSTFSNDLVRVSNNVPVKAAGVLTEGQFKAVLRALDQLNDVDLLAAPDVTTLSGRQAQIQIVDMKEIVTGVTNSPGTNSLQFVTTSTPVGAVLDVIPYVASDGYTVQLTVIPTVTEFAGYDEPGKFVPSTNSGLTPATVLPLPRFRVRQVAANATLLDGQTLVLVGPISEDAKHLKDKVPLLGNVPVLGPLFRSEHVETKKKQLLIFVTPTLLDPAGNRLHTDKDMEERSKRTQVQLPK